MCGIRYFAVLLFLLSFNVFSTYGYRSFFPKRIRKSSLKKKQNMVS